jgi:hypothetical protein
MNFGSDAWKKSKKDLRGLRMVSELHAKDYEGCLARAINIGGEKAPARQATGSPDPKWKRQSEE